MFPENSPQPVRKPDADVREGSVFNKQNSSRRGESKLTGTCRFRLPGRLELLPMRYIQNLGHKVAAALRLVSRRRGGDFKERSSSGRAKPLVAPVDSHRAEAIDDCIEFIKSSNSVSQKMNSSSLS